MSYCIFLVLYHILQKNRLYCIIWQCYVLWKMLFDCSLSCLDCVFFYMWYAILYFIVMYCTLLDCIRLNSVLLHFVVFGLSDGCRCETDRFGR